VALLPDALWALSIWWKAAGIVLGLFVLLLIIGMIQNSRERARDAAKGAPASKFPVADASGHLICKNCGKVFAGDTTTVERAREFYAKASRRDMFVVPCGGCGRPNLFLESELRGWRAGG
jgi:hypothetical protein